jgi:tetratricopeptide (TPR) repeat protein
MARAWRVLLFILSNAGRHDDMAAAAERLIEHAMRAGEDRLVRRGASVYATAVVLGSTPVDEALEKCRAIAARVDGDRRSEAIVFGALAVLHAMAGEFELARTLYRREREYLAALGPSRELATTSLDSARVELLAGDHAAAERELRRDDAELASMGETYFRSTVLGMLARTLVESGAVEEADRFSMAAQAMADADDVDTQILWRLSRSRLLAASQPAGAVQLADEAVTLATQTHGLQTTADAYRSRACVLLDLGRDEAATADLDEAAGLYERKGDRASLEATRALRSARLSGGAAAGARGG